MQKLIMVLVLCFTGIASVNAAPVVYTFYDVVFDDGATLSGTFTYDEDIVTGGGTSKFASHDFTTTDVAGSPLGDTYSCASNCENAGGADFGFDSDSVGNVLYFDLAGISGHSDLGGGGTFNLELATYEYFRSQGKSGRSVVSGYVSSVPVPAAAWLFGSALVGLVGVGRRKKAQV